MANEYGLNYRAAPVAPVAVPKTQAQPAGALPPDLSTLSDALMAQQKFDSADALREQRYPARGWGNIGANAWNAFRAQRKEKQGNEITQQAEAKALAAQQAQEDQIYQFTKQTLLANNYTEQEADPIARLAAKGKDIKPFLHEKVKRDLEVKTEVDDEGVETSQYIDTATMQPEGEKWVSGRRAPVKPDKPQYSTISELDAQGNTVERTVPTDQAVAAGPRITKGPTGREFSASEVAKAKSDTRGLKEATTNLTTLRDKVAKEGFVADWWFNEPEKIGDMAGAYSNARNSMRQLLELGVLQQADLALLEKDITDPTSTTDMTGRKAERLVAVLDQVLGSSQRRLDNIRMDYGDALDPPASGLPKFDSVGAVKAAMASGQLKSGDKFMSPEGVKVVP